MSKKFGLKVGIGATDKLSQRIDIDLNKNEKNDLVEVRDMLQKKLEELKNN